MSKDFLSFQNSEANLHKDPLKQYKEDFHNAATRNAILERMAARGEVPLSTMVVFADFIETFPLVPLKTQADYGIHHRRYSYPKIIDWFFNKIALDIQHHGELPTADSVQMADINNLLQQSPEGNFTEDEFRGLYSARINVNAIPNLILARRLKSIALQQDVEYERLPLPPVEKRVNFQREWQEAQHKGVLIQTLTEGHTEQTIKAFGSCLRAYPFIPIKLSAQTARGVMYDFDDIVTEFFDKISDLVADGEPVKGIADQQAERAYEIIDNKGLTLELLAASQDSSIPRLDGYNGYISPCTIPNLITAHRLLVSS